MCGAEVLERRVRRGRGVVSIHILTELARRGKGRAPGAKMPCSAHPVRSPAGGRRGTGVCGAEEHVSYP